MEGKKTDTLKKHYIQKADRRIFTWREKSGHSKKIKNVEKIKFDIQMHGLHSRGR